MYRKPLNLLWALLLATTMSACTRSTIITPTSVIESIEQTYTPQPTTPSSNKFTPTAVDISSEVISDVDTYLTELASQKLFSGSVLIAHKGKILLSEGYGMADRAKNIPNTALTRFRLGSITKQFTAMAIMILESQDKLNILDPICNYVPDCPPAWQSITVNHLLTHTSGIHDFTSMANYSIIQATPSAPEDTIARFKNLPLDFQAGEKWSYSNSNYIVLGTIIERVYGQSYENFLQQYIFTPIELHNTGYDHNSNTLAVGYSNQYTTKPADFVDMSIPFAAGALYSTVEDLYKWDQALTTEKLVTQAYLDAMFNPRVEIPESEGLAYGYGWMIGTENGRRLISHGGGINGFVSINALYPDDQLTIIMLSNQETSQIELMKEIIAKKIFGDK